MTQETKDSQESMKRDLEKHPELSPLIDVDSRGNVVCFGWVSPIYEFPVTPEECEE